MRVADTRRSPLSVACDRSRVSCRLSRKRVTQYNADRLSTFVSGKKEMKHCSISEPNISSDTLIGKHPLQWIRELWSTRTLYVCCDQQNTRDYLAKQRIILNYDKNEKNS